MTPDETVAAYRLLMDSATSIVLLASDTFDYATADAETIEPSDAIALLPIIRDFGQSAIIAFMAVKRREEPLPPLRTPGYQAAVVAVKALNINWEWYK